MRQNRITIVQGPEGWDASVDLSCGFKEEIAGLYDFESANAWTHMHLLSHNRYSSHPSHTY